MAEKSVRDRGGGTQALAAASISLREHITRGGIVIMFLRQLRGHLCRP